MVERPDCRTAGRCKRIGNPPSTLGTEPSVSTQLCCGVIEVLSYESGINLPWLNRSKHDAEIRESQSRVNVQRAELETQRSMIFQEIQEALIRVNSAARLIE